MTVLLAVFAAMNTFGEISESEDAEVAFQHAFIRNHGLAPKVEEKFSRNRHPDAQWYPKAGLGLFIHWGLSSVTGWSDLSWGMIKPSKEGNGKNVERWGLPSPARNVPPNEYWKQIKGFDAAKFDPDKILAAAKKAGFEYAILTTKHHEGFCLWPSEVGDMTTKNYLNGRDLVGEFAAACRRQGLKVCFYYSPPDWYFERDYMSFSRDPDIPDAGCDWEPRKRKEKTPAFEAAYREYNRVQIEELLTRYGKVDMLWFDGMGSDCVSVKRLRELQPGIIINDRGRSYGDVFTQDSECRFPRERRPKGCWWEYIHTLCDGGWGYRYHECYKPVAWLISETGRARSWNGNFVANVCPNAHGELPDVYYKIMDEMAAWMKANGRVFKEAEGTDLWPEHCNVAVTRTGKIHHFLYDWLQTGDIICDRFPKPKSVTVGGTQIPYDWKNGTLKISIPYQKIGNLTTVVDVVAE